LTEFIEFNQLMPNLQQVRLEKQIARKGFETLVTVSKFSRLSRVPKDISYTILPENSSATFIYLR